MNTKLVGYLILLSIILSALVPTSIAISDEEYWWNDDYSFRQELVMPIDTCAEQAKFQPIDISIKFNDSCWAKSENEHSIRVIYQDQEYFEELECQIYDLKNSDENYINQCNLVFLVPETASGNERYFVYYDDSEKSSPNYPDHVDLGEGEYSIEPITGVSISSEYYKIVEEGDIVYAVSKSGYISISDEGTSQYVTKLKPGTKEVLPKYGENAFSFNLVYWWKTDNFNPKFSSDKLIAKKAYNDGNLMVKFGIISQSRDGLIQSTVIYKYYYSPNDFKRIYADVKHEVIDYPLPVGSDIDVSFGSLGFGISKSSKFEDLNFGSIPKYLHFKNDENQIVPFDVPYPKNLKWENPIAKEDDYDLSNTPWLSLDYGETGEAHGVILNTSQVVITGDDERNGIELQLYTNRYSILGYDVRYVNTYLSRNCFEPEDQSQDLVLPSNYVVEFDAEFCTTRNNGYNAIEQEAEMFHELINYKPEGNNNITDGDEEEEKFTLTVYGLLSNNVKSKIKLLRTLLQGPQITAEVYNQDYSYSGKLNRIPITEDLKIDWRNITLFQKYIFKELKAGKYIVKIWLENTLTGDKRELIGVDVVDLQKNTKKYIYCKPEGKIVLDILDQNNNGIKNVEVNLLKENTVIVQNFSNSDGKAYLNAPCGLFEKYPLRIIYKGFLINQEEIRLGIINKIIPFKKKINFDVHNFKVEIKDSENKGLSSGASLCLTSNEMDYPLTLKADTIIDGVYSFNYLYPADYTLKLEYGQFEIFRNISIPETAEISFNLYDFKTVIKDSWNLTPEVSYDVSLRNLDYEEKIFIKPSSKTYEEFIYKNIFPGNYQLKINYKNFSFTEDITIPSENLNIVFPAEFKVDLSVYDTHGSPLNNANIKIIRDNKEISKSTNENGLVTFLLPPGEYKNEIYYDNELIAQRNIDFLSESSFDIVTDNEPIKPWIITIFIIIVSIIAGIICFVKNKKMFFLKILPIFIVLIVLVSPWWALQNDSDDNSGIENSTSIYLNPIKVVTLVSTDNVTGGMSPEFNEKMSREFDIFGTPVDLEFESIMNMFPIIIFISFIGIISSIILQKLSFKKLSFLFLTLALIALIMAFFGINFGVSEFIRDSTGSFSGNGNIDVFIPGEIDPVVISSNWGPSIGYYLYIAAIIILVLAYLFTIRKKIIDRKKVI